MASSSILALLPCSLPSQLQPPADLPAVPEEATRGRAGQLVLWHHIITPEGPSAALVKSTSSCASTCASTPLVLWCWLLAADWLAVQRGRSPLSWCSLEVTAEAASHSGVLMCCSVPLDDCTSEAFQRMAVWPRGRGGAVGEGQSTRQQIKG